MNNHKKDRILSILNPGDTVVSVTEHVIAVRNINGETRVLWYRIDENGLPRLDGKSLRITYVNGNRWLDNAAFDFADDQSLPF